MLEVGLTAEHADELVRALSTWGLLDKSDTLPLGNTAGGSDADRTNGVTAQVR